MTRSATVRKNFPFADPNSIKRAAVVCHRNADADAYLSAYGVSKLLRSLAPDCEVDIVTPEGMTTLTKKLSSIFTHRVVEDSAEDYDLFVAVDVGDTELLKSWLTKMRESKGLKVLIDHHPLRGAEVYDHVVVDEEATSASEVVCRIFAELKVAIDPTTAQALLEGILFDSQHLAIAGAESLRTVVRLLDAGANISEARKTLRSEPDPGEVMAKLKGSQRLKIFRLGPWIGATTEVGSFQAQVARALIFLGADVAAVGGSTDEETRVSLRSSQRFNGATGVHLGTGVAALTGADMGGHGGGHATAASFTSKEPVDKSLTAAVKRLAILLGAEVQGVV